MAKFLELGLVLCLHRLVLVNGDLLYPVLADQPEDDADVPNISQTEIAKAFDYARQQATKRSNFENNFLNTDYVLTKPISADGRMFTNISQISMHQHRIQEIFEDATQYLVKQYNLTKIQVKTALPKIALPDDEPLVQECKKLREDHVCNSTAKYRTADGRCNNLRRPNLGSAFSCFRKMVDSTYADGISSPRISVENVQLPGPRLVSESLERNVNLTSSTVSHMLAMWGEFIAHDVGHTVQVRAGDDLKTFNCCPLNSSVNFPSSCLPIDIPETDSFYSKFNMTCMSFVRSAACSQNCRLGGPRHQVNQQTSFLDGSAVYGVSDEDMRTLRTLQNGDSRVNTQPILTALSTIWMRQHNRIAEVLANNYPELSDEILFQEAKRIVGAQIQVISYKEFLPLVLGPDLMKHFQLQVLEDGYSKYEPNVDPTTSNEFTTGAFRFGHPMVQDFFSLIGRNKSGDEELSLQNNQFHPITLYQGKLDLILRGTYHQPAQDFAPHLAPSLANHLFETLHGPYALDLHAISIQRGREQGLPTYVGLLKYCYNISITSFEDLNITMPEMYWKELPTVFRHVDDVDVWFITMERHLPGSVLGPVASCIIASQFHNYKFGDRFYFEHGGESGSFSKGQIQELRKTTLARIFCDNSDSIEKITPDVFRLITTENEMTGCEDIPKVEYDFWMHK